ncbi:NUDIX hydrolase [Chitinophaga sedimenti]|uniref:NUDIX hydrolase n=1 Tax=Chitinophaga sedimenti TaxID=2033606 RepID=UPI002006B109|nr:NUDIX hydrolase [Chitinophaga sedimenti]MCK7558134.1 NUDIX hydrolase [Chitinophaga sedimenti]
MAVSVDCVIFGWEDETLKVLLLPSLEPEHQGCWMLPGDTVMPAETLEAAAWRVLSPHEGLSGLDLEQVHAFGTMHRSPVGSLVSVAYYSLVNAAHAPFDNPLRWFPLKRLPPLLPYHKDILDACYRRLQHKVIDRPIGMDLLPDKFSLRTLQHLYETILDVKLDRRNFRKKFFNMDILIDLNEEEDSVPHRPARLYRFDAGKYDQRTKRPSVFNKCNQNTLKRAFRLVWLNEKSPKMPFLS